MRREARAAWNGDDLIRRGARTMNKKHCASHHLRAVALKLAILFCACLCPPIFAVAAPGCDADARAQWMTLGRFCQAVDGLAKLQSQPAAASAMLLCLQKSHAALSETLM